MKKRSYISIPQIEEILEKDSRIYKKKDFDCDNMLESMTFSSAHDMYLS